MEVTLPDCATDRIVPGTRAISGRGAAAGEAATALRSENPTAGGYGWLDLDALGPGRYYAVYTACVPRGGEGLAYLAKIERADDLDWPGYCALSVGCFNVAHKFELRRRYGAGPGWGRRWRRLSPGYCWKAARTTGRASRW